MGEDQKTNLSEEAKKMRTASTQEERSEAAKKMGHEGGKHSHSGRKKEEK